MALEKQPHGGALRRPREGNIPAMEAGKLRKAAQDRHIEEDPDAARVEIAQQLTEWTRKIVKRGMQKGDPPDRQVMDILREFRLTQEAIAEVRKNAGAEAQAKEFFAQLDSRMVTLARTLPEGIKLPIEIPA